MEKKYLEMTKMLNFDVESIQSLIKNRKWIELDEYNTNSNVKYKITIYDTAHYQWDNHSNYIHIVNESGRILNTDHYLISTDMNNGICTIYINTI